MPGGSSRRPFCLTRSKPNSSSRANEFGQVRRGPPPPPRRPQPNEIEAEKIPHSSPKHSESLANCPHAGPAHNARNGGNPDRISWRHRVRGGMALVGAGLGRLRQAGTLPPPEPLSPRCVGRFDDHGCVGHCRHRPISDRKVRPEHGRAFTKSVSRRCSRQILSCNAAFSAGYALLKGVPITATVRPPAQSPGSKEWSGKAGAARGDAPTDNRAHPNVSTETGSPLRFQASEGKFKRPRPPRGLGGRNGSRGLRAATGWVATARNPRLAWKQPRGHLRFPP